MILHEQSATEQSISGVSPGGSWACLGQQGACSFSTVTCPDSRGRWIWLFSGWCSEWIEGQEKVHLGGLAGSEWIDGQAQVHTPSRLRDGACYVYLDL